jgi:hypothetical protein
LGKVAAQLFFQIEAAVIRADSDNARARRVARFGGGDFRLLEPNREAASFGFLARKFGDDCAASHHDFGACGNGLKISDG